MLTRADRALEQLSTPAEQRTALLAPAQAMTDGEAFRQHRGHGFALFASPGFSQVAALDEPPPEALVVGGCFHIKPLLRAVARNRRFNVLALSAGDARLFSATPYEWDELKLDALQPAAQAEAMEMESAYAPINRSGTGHTIAASPEEVRHGLIAGDMNRVAFAVRHALRDDAAPLLLAAEPQVAGHFRPVAHMGNLQPVGLALNPFAFAPGELHRKAVELMAPVLDSEPEAALEQVRGRLGSAEANVGIRLEEILQAARDGRVETVIVAEDEALWGRFDPDRGGLIAHGHQTAEEGDLLNEAAILALRGGGRAFALPIERLPRRCPAVATYRF